MTDPVNTESTNPDQLFTMFNEIGIVNQLATTQFERNLPEGLTPSQFSVLNIFVRLGGVRSPKQLADAFQVTKGAMTNTLEKLAQKGCIEISADPNDGRRKQVRITQKGKRLREQSIRQAGPTLSQVAQVLTTEEIQTMIPTLQKLRAYLDNNR